MARDLRDEKIATLEEENRQLKALLEPKGFPSFPGWGISPRGVLLLDALLRSPGMVSNEWLANRCDITPDSVKVMVCRLRKQLRTVRAGFIILTVRGFGYEIPENDKKRFQRESNKDPKHAAQ